MRKLPSGLFIITNFVVMGVLLAACGTASPTTTTPPTAQPTQPATEVVATKIVPTQASAPTATATGLPETVATKTEDIVGVWRGRGGSPNDPPATYWYFNPDGTYRVTFDMEQFAGETSVEAGKFSFDGQQVVLEATQSGCAGGPEAIGHYEVKKVQLAVNVTRLNFTALDELCTNRQTALGILMPFVKVSP